MSEFFLQIVNMSISASWIVLAVLLLRLLLKKAPKWITVLLWGIVAIRLICPFSVESVMSLIPSAETISPLVLIETPEINTGIPIVNNTLNPIIQESTVTIAPEKSINTLQLLVLILSKVWIIGVALLFIYTVVSYFHIKRKIGTAVLLRDNIYQSESVISPFVLGIIKPKIYLLFNMSEQDAEHVIAHEQAHIKRKDHWWKPFGFLLLAIHWFNPLMWLGYVLLCRDIELACDEKVIKELNTEQKADYSQALLSCSVNRRMIAACPLAFGEVGVKDRVKSVLNYKKPAFGIIAVAIIASIVTAVCFLTNPRTTLNDELAVFIDGQIMEHHSSQHTDEHFSAIDYEVLDVDKFLNETTVYMWVLYQEYSCDNGEIKVEAGAHIPTVITAKRTGSHGHYELVEYWEPRDGSYYAEDIKEKLPWYLHNKAIDSQRYIDEQLKFCENAAKEYFSSKAEKLTWTYTPGLSFIGHYCKNFHFDLEYTHIEATCTSGEMWNLEAEGQPSDTSMRFKNGKTVYWTPSETFEKIPQKSEVTFKVYDGETQLYECTVVFECVERNKTSAEFEIYLKETDGLQVLYLDGSIRFVEQSSISNVGGADNPNNIITEIIDRTVTEGIPTDQALQPFCVDEKYVYSFPSIRSEYVIVKFKNGDEMTVSNALGKGLIAIADLDRWNIQYTKKEYNGDPELNENGDIVRISSYPKDLYHTTLGHFQTLYEQTPTEEIQEKYDNGEFVITKMHYYNTKKEWCADGYTYKYRLEITGRMNNAAKDSTYIVLSNNENITFEQTWKASGLSSLSTDYFKLKDAMIVGHK